MNDEDYTFTIDTTATSTIDVSTIGTQWTGDTLSYIHGDGTSPTITIDNTDYTYSSVLDDMIDIAEVEKMCEEYPALKTAYEKFKTIYDMTLQDWKGNKQDD